MESNRDDESRCHGVGGDEVKGMKTEEGKLDPVTLAVIKARLDGIVREMARTVLRTSRNPVLYAAKDLTCSILTPDAKILNMVDSIPIHLLSLDGSLRAVVEFFKDDTHPGDCFVNNSPYHGNNHVGDWPMFSPVFYEGELICWVGTLCHLIDTGAHIPSNVDALAKDVYEEGIHFPALRMVRDYQEIPEIIRLIKANFRYPDQWHGDFLAQIGSLFVAEREMIKLCQKYGAGVIRRFQNEVLEYGSRQMIEEIRKLPKGTWSIEALSEKVKPLAPDGRIYKVKMSIDPDEATITYDLTEMPDQLPWGLNLSQATARGSCLQGTMPALAPTLPRNSGVFQHIKVLLREGAVAGIPKFPAATTVATIGTAEEVTNMVFNLWEQVEPGRGHGGGGMANASVSSSGGTDFRRDNAPYGHMYFLAGSGGGASKGNDGWPGYLDNASMGNQFIESIELNELKVPELVWEIGIQTDSGGAGQWRGAPGTSHRIQPRHQTITAIPWGVGHTDAPKGVAGGKDGALADHWIEKHATGEKTQQLTNVDRFFLKEDEDWVALTNGGGGYGDPLKRDPEAVREDARNGIVSLEAARDEYGVVLNTEPELYEVDYKATEKLRAQLRKKGE